MAGVKIETIGDSLYWSYANLAMWMALKRDRLALPQQKHFILRNRNYSGFRSGTMRVQGFLNDERLKIKEANQCWYCGAVDMLSMDHLIPQSRYGSDGGENLIPACRRCNSSKGSKDVLVWMSEQGRFPRARVLTRYLKMAIFYCMKHDLMNVRLTEISTIQPEPPFALDRVPHEYPTPRI